MKYWVYEFVLSGAKTPVAQLIFDCDPFKEKPTKFFYRDLKLQDLSFWQRNEQSLEVWVRATRSKTIDLRFLKKISQKEAEDLFFIDLL